MNTYLSHLDYQRAPTGNETATLVGNSLRLSHPVAVGDTAIFVTPNTTVQLNAYDQITIFDGPYSEVVTVGATVGVGSASFQIASPGFQFAHVSGVPMCSDGTGGSLSQTIINASEEVESICRQPLLQAVYTETYSLQSMQASLDAIGTLNVRTTKNPVTSVASALLTTDVASGQAIAVTNVKYQGQVVSIVGAGGSIPRCTNGFIDLTFTAGFVYAALPQKIKQACIWLTSELLSDRINPTGAAIDMQGKIHTQYRLKDEKKSSLYMRAEEALREFTVKVY